MKEKEDQYRIKKFNNKNNAFKESDQPQEKLSKRVFKELIGKRSEDPKIPSLRVFHKKLNADLTKRVLNTENNSITTELDEDFNKIRIRTEAKPSELIKRINDRKNLMPSEYEDMYEKKLNRSKSNLQFLNTRERVFTEYIIDTEEQDKIKENIFHPGREKMRQQRFYPHAQEEVGNLISYKYAPTFRDQVK